MNETMNDDLDTVVAPRRITTERSGIVERKNPEVGRRLAALMAEAGLLGTQEQMGKLFGVAQVTIGAWLRGDKLPPIHTGIQLARKFGVNVEWLYTGEGPKYPLPETGILKLARDIAMAPPAIQGILRAVLSEAQAQVRSQN